MYILPSSYKIGKSRAIVLTVVVVMALTAFLPLIFAGEEADASESTSFEPSALKPGQRSGDHYLDDYPPEYFAYGSTSGSYFGSGIDTLDFNGDGYEDMIVTAPIDGSGKVYIFDGSTQLKFPDLGVGAEDARWELSGGSRAFGTDFSMGDVNGDGYTDVLVASTSGSQSSSHLFYGGPYVDSLTSLSDNASFTNKPYGYYGPWCALGDLDGDGYDDVLSGCAGYTYERQYPPGYNYFYYYWYGQANWWFSDGDMSGSYSYNSADGSLTPPYSYGYDYGTYGYAYHYGYIGQGGVACGDMDGDGRDEVAFGNSGRNIDRNSYVGSVSVMYPNDNIRDFDEDDILDSNSYMDWVDYTGSSYMDCVGSDPQIHDYNDDGYGDLFFYQGWYTSTYYQNSGKYLYVIDGSGTRPSGVHKVSDDDTYDKRFDADDVSGFGPYAIGDFDGNDKPDLAIANAADEEVYVVLWEDWGNVDGKIDAKEKSVFTVYAPDKSSKYFAHPVEYYRYYYYEYGSKFRTLCFMNRDDDGLDDLFIGDPGAGYFTSSGPGVVYGISNYDMFGIGTFESSGGDLPDGKTFYAEYKPYTFKGSAWNKWSIFGPELEWEFRVGIYSGTVRYTNPGLSPTTGIIEVINDPYNIIRVDPDSLILDTDEENDLLTVFFDVYFTLELPAESDLDIMFYAKADHMEYQQFYPDLGSVKNRFMWVGELDGFWKKGTGDSREDEWVPFKDDSWVPEDSSVRFSGMRLLYNGTEDFMKDFEEEPFYPSNDLFNVTLESSIGGSDVDPDSSGRDFVLEAPGGDRPIAVEYFIDQEGIPPEKIINEVPVFTANVDIDTPTQPPGVRVHADGFDDPNTIVDNDHELYVTWNEPGEFNSGVAYYEVECDGIIYETGATFAKVMTNSVGDVEVKVRAVDRVAHVGDWATSSIFIDDKILEFTGFHPVEGTWFNTVNPQVGITITDLGGRAIIGPSVEYSTSKDGGATWSEWKSAENELNAKSIDVFVTPMLSEGTDNMVMFRASDEAGNIMTSEAYNISIDVSGVHFQELRVNGDDDWEGMWLPDSIVDIEVEVDLQDPLSGVAGSTLQYRYSSRGRADLNSAVWNSLNVQSGADVTASISDLELNMGDMNFIQFRARDNVGNAYTYSPAYNIWINTMPRVEILSPEGGSEFMDDEFVTFDGTAAMDVDGDDLTYTWTDTITFKGETQTVVLGADADDGSRFSEKLLPGDHSLVLTVSDGIHDVDSDPVIFTVLERIIPIWLSDDDEDSDGMPNYWEYNYFLGWDDASNKDNLYNTNMAGMSRSELYDDLRDKFAGDASAATAANDADGDGHTDFEEYLAGSDPTEALEFPVYKMAGEEADEEQGFLIPVLIAVCLVVIIVMIVVVVVNNGSIKRDLESARVKDAEEEKHLMENALSSGGKERLDNLLAAAKGEATALPQASPQTAQALPSAEQVGEPQPMEAQQMSAQPMDAQPMQAAPMDQPNQPEGGNQ